MWSRGCAVIERCCCHNDVGRQCQGISCGLNVEVGSSGQVVSICLSSATPRTQAPCLLGSVVAEAPPANGCLFLLAACFLLCFFFFFFWSPAGLCDFQQLSVVSCLCLTGRSNLGLPAWLGQHQQSQWPAHGSADVPIRYAHGDTQRGWVTWKCITVTCRLTYHSFTLGCAVFVILKSSST